MIEVRRPSDGELCGHVRPADGGWEALTVFGGTLGVHAEEGEAEAQVLDEGLASLAERWEYQADPTADWEVVCIQEADPTSVRLALGYYSLPGVPTVVVTRQQLNAGVSLRRG